MVQQASLIHLETLQRRRVWRVMVGLPQSPRRSPDSSQGRQVERLLPRPQGALPTLEDLLVAGYKETVILCILESD